LLSEKTKEMNQLPSFVPILFIITTVLALFIYYRALNNSHGAIYLMSTWLLIQAALGVTGFYQVAGKLTPRFLVLILPPLVFIGLLMSTNRGRRLTGQPNIKWLTLFHTIRIPVEWILFFLFVHKDLPQVMTFEGRNFDILAGVSAPFIYYFGFVKRGLSAKIIIGWNLIGMALLLNIVIIALLSMPSPFQKFGFEQPNSAFFYVPYNWLPCGLVPMVLYAHLVSIRQLLVKKNAILSL
jgi:hypothetical protein